MSSWSDVQAADPVLAQRVQRTFRVRKHATLATLRRDGSPRISGIEVEFGDDGEVYLGMMPGSRKAADLQRDPRFALHCPTDDPPCDEPARWAGEGKMSGRAVEASDGAAHRFRLDLSEVVLTRVGETGDHLVIEAWHEGRGVSRVRRE